MPSPKELAKALAYRGEIRNTPQNSFLGGVANFLSPVSEFLDRGKLPESIPLLGGMSAADVTGVKETESLVRDMSYGKFPISGASLQTAKVDPRLFAVADFTGLGGAMLQAGKGIARSVAGRFKDTVPNTRGNYETKQDGPFYRVTPRNYIEGESRGRSNIGINGQSSNSASNAGADREIGRGIQERQQGGALASQVVPPPETNKPFEIARQYTKATQGTDFGFPDMPVSSFEKQSGIARVHQLGLEGSPEYKTASNS